jgi:DNA-binding transcriptional ArsR family regulator
LIIRSQSKLSFSILVRLKLFNVDNVFIFGAERIKEIVHPNAYLKNIRNVRCGLVARTKILVLLERQGFAACKLAKESALSYGVVMYHLRLLENEGTVERKGNRRYVWLATGLGQKRLG